MELTERVIALEKDASAIKLDVAVIRSNYATKADITSEASSIRSELHKEINAQTWRLITFVCGFGTALVGVTYFIFTHVAK